MATLCTHCGAELQDDARYCKICGTLVPSHPFSPASAFPVVRKSEAVAPLARRQNEDSTSADADVNGAPPRSTPKDGPPSWIARLGADAPNHGSDEAQAHPREAFSLAVTPHDLAATGRELRVKIWDQVEAAAPPEDEVEDRPTSPLVAGPPAIIVRRNSTPVPERKAQDTRIDELERLDTVRLAAQVASPPQPQTLPQTLSQLPGGPWQRPEALPFASTPGGVPPLQTNQELKATPLPQPSVAAQKRWNSRKPLLFVLVALVLLIAGGGVATWIVKYQPFAVAPITKPQQTFSDQRLGLSLLYPSSWQAQNDRTAAAVHFVDSSHTIQVNITVATASAGSAGQYVQQEAGRMGLSARKAGPALTFAETSWQQIRGSVQQQGANYSVELLVAGHNSRLFTITFLAPQTVFAQADQLVFSKMRSSLQFLA